MKNIESKTRYLILGSGRSGTTFIHSLLAGHPNISALTDEIEVNSGFFSQGISTFTFKQDPKKEKALGFLKLFDALSSVNETEQTIAYGLKVAIHYPYEAKMVVDCVQKFFPKLKIILVYRSDLVAQQGSVIRANATKNYHSDKIKSNRAMVKNFSISKYAFKRYASIHLTILNTLKSLQKTNELLKINYENDVLKFNDDTLINICDFLNIPFKNPTWQKLKKVSPSPDKYIKNYHQLSNILLNLQNNSLTNKNKFLKNSRFNYYLLYKIFMLRFFNVEKI